MSDEKDHDDNKESQINKIAPNNVDSAENIPSYAKQQNKILAKQTWVLLASVCVAVASVVATIYLYLHGHDTFKRTQKPNMTIKQIQHAKCDYEIIIYNAGPGVAYNVQFEVHINDNIGDIGKIFAYDIVKSAIYIQTKDRDRLFAYWHTGDDLPSVNPPAIFYPKLESAYSIKKLQTPALTGLIITISYKDALGNRYYYHWDGYESHSDVGAYDIKLNYRNEEEPLSVLYQRLLYDKINTQLRSDYCKSDFDYNAEPAEYREWLKREAEWLESKGYKDMKKKLEEIETNPSKNK